jgi:hypothetical protein
MKGFYGPTPGMRGVCPVCDDEWGLRQDGTVRYHRSSAAGSWWCEGSSKPAKVTTFLPCQRGDCGHECITEHDANTDDEPCSVDGCGCQGVIYPSPDAVSL